MKRWLIICAICTILGWLLWCVVALSIYHPPWIPAWLTLRTADAGEIFARRGQFGDAFGAFNALVSSLALIGLLFTLKAQQDQLTAQDRISASNDLLVRQQQFQEQYYRSIDTYSAILSEIKVLDEQGQLLSGRMALYHLWSNRLTDKIEVEGIPFLKQALYEQQNAQVNERLGAWVNSSNLVIALKKYTEEANCDTVMFEKSLEKLGVAWSALYLSNRFQLDSLFRAWYTVYRILGTSSKYKLDPDACNLYSAMFRAQLSWVELSFLLINQSGLPNCPNFPKACRLSNLHAIFDNLDSENDLVSLILKIKVKLNVGEQSKNCCLRPEAFGTQMGLSQNSEKSYGNA